jgi:hypothetical protein
LGEEDGLKRYVKKYPQLIAAAGMNSAKARGHGAFWFIRSSR